MLAPPTIAPVFIGYRRDDTGHAAGRLRDSLAALGHDVWFDLDQIRIGVPYRAKITGALRECEVALILIGPQWATVTGRNGDRRIDDPDDDVRIEVELALARPDITLVPVLVDQARMPRREDLPDDLRQICELNGAALQRDTWSYCVKDLHETIERSARRGWRAWGEALLVAAAAAVPAALLISIPALSTNPKTHTISDTHKTINLVAQRAILWGMIMAATLAWVAWRRPGHRWVRALRAGALWGAFFGALGAIVHAIPTYLIHASAWGSLNLDTVKSVAYSAGIAVTAAGVGALVGAAWNPPGVKRGLVAGLIAGAALGTYVHEVIANDSTGYKVRTAILIAVGVLAVTIATEWITRALSTRGSP